MNIKDIYGNDCPTLYTLSLISGKWRLPILWKIYEFKTIRFNALKKEVYGITNIMLTKCLQEFEKNNVVKRTQYEEIPPRQSDQKVFVADITKIKHAIGWKPKVSAYEGVRRMVEWVKTI